MFYGANLEDNKLSMTCNLFHNSGQSPITKTFADVTVYLSSMYSLCHYANMPMQYAPILKAVKMILFR